ncbi:hypothetical protein PAHAL_9G544300 [Panicum hallii]|uniref:Uncharacterized protein n=1 Tax=Panicum hallii TaxID=206008 RepID=A0A2S3ISP6_9POAL|nr:hypothetical protein PAHAL_9G544300 [Panicum hallii]
MPDFSVLWIAYDFCLINKEEILILLVFEILPTTSSQDAGRRHGRPPHFEDSDLRRVENLNLSSAPRSGSDLSVAGRRRRRHHVAGRWRWRQFASDFNRPCQ